MSRRELERRVGDPAYLDSRRKGVKSTVGRKELTHSDLLKTLDDLLCRFNAIVCGTEHLANPADRDYRLAILSESSRTLVTA